MLNFYNYYGKIHPELVKKLKKMEEKTSGNNNVLVIRPLSTKDTPEPFDVVYPEGETVYYDESKYGGNIEAYTGIKIEITKDLLVHIVYDIDKIIFYLPENFEGLVYDKKRIRRNVPQCQFEHKSKDQDSGEYENYIIICTVEGSVATGIHFVIDKVDTPR